MKEKNDFDEKVIDYLHKDCVKAAKWLNKICQESKLPISFTQEDIFELQDFIDQYAYDQDLV